MQANQKKLRGNESTRSWPTSDQNSKVPPRAFFNFAYANTNIDFFTPNFLALTSSAVRNMHMEELALEPPKPVKI